jgi:hypothetical protein
MRIFYITSVTLVGLVQTSSTAHAETALEHLQSEPRPVFKEGHTLLPLSRWGWSLPVETSVELCEHWGYVLEFGSYATKAVAEKAHDPQSRQGKVCALTAENPQRYPLFVITHRPIGSKDFQDHIQRTGKDLPAYEFPTGDPDVRVLARKHRRRNQWLVTAWAAAGEARDVKVFIDEVGEITLEPPIVKMELLDKNAVRPSIGFD